MKTKILKAKNALYYAMFKNSITKILFGVSLIILLFSGTSFISDNNNSSVKYTNTIEQYTNMNYVSNLKRKAKDSLISEVNKYFKLTYPTTKLTAENLVNKCLEYDIDIIFVLAQGKIESGFGTAGKASVTNSVWNVGTFDNGTVLYRYAHADESIEPYLKLLKNTYLIEITNNGDTISKKSWELIKRKNFTSYHGYRYATAKGYEALMRHVVLSINMSTDIKFYQKIISMSEEELTTTFY